MPASYAGCDRGWQVYPFGSDLFSKGVEDGMLESKAKYYKTLADKMIEKLTLRNMEGYYAATKEDALQLIKDKFLKEGVSVAL